jgi:membrane protease YdiL (CAAX protease family)
LEQQQETIQETMIEEEKQSRLFSLLFNNQISIWKYILLIGLISLVPSIIISAILGLSGAITEETAPQFEGSALSLLITLVIIGPLLETLLMGGGLWILSFITKRKVLLAVISAFIWAVMHSLCAIAWGLVVMWPFFVFSCSYLNWRKRSWWHAILVTSCVHAFQNILPTIAAISIQ